MTIAMLAAAIAFAPSTGRPSLGEAKHLAKILFTCADRFPRDANIDAPLLAAVAWRESGFRPDAVREPKTEGGPSMLGLMQLHEGFIPTRMLASRSWADPKANVEEFRVKLLRLFRHHRDNCPNDDHHLIAHHFSGYRVTPKARKAAAEVMRRRDALLSMVRPAARPAA